MTYLCLLTGELPAERLLTVVPRLCIAKDVVWADAGGLPLRTTVERLERTFGVPSRALVRVGVATTPVAAEVAARHAATRVTYVAPGDDRAFLAPFPLHVLTPDPALANLLDGAGVETCGDLACLSRESVEVRFGAAGATLWRLARADDPRRLFAPVPRALPEASLEWTDYALRRAERLVFVVNALCGSVCDTLRGRGEGAVAMTLRFSLANETAYEHPIRAARPTASQSAWMRIVRLELEKIALPDAVTGISLRVESAAALGGKQGDVFDRGFGTARAAEEAIAELLDDQGAVVVEPETSAHPLLDRRTLWTALSASQAVERRGNDRARRGGAGCEAAPALALQLLPTPVRVTVATVPRRDSDIPRSYRDGSGTHAIVEAAGPDRVSGGQWDAPYAREYYRCVTGAGVLVWLYRDTRTGAWYLHGWWD